MGKIEEEKLESAINAYLTSNISIRDAAQTFGLAKSTLSPIVLIQIKV